MFSFKIRLLTPVSEKAMAPHSSTLAWKIPWTEEPGRLQSMGSRRVGHDWATSLSRFTFMHWRRKWQPTPVFLPGESRDEGAWWAAIYGVTQSRTRLTQLSGTSSSNSCLVIQIAYASQLTPVHISKIWLFKKHVCSFHFIFLMWQFALDSKFCSYH